MRDHVMFSAGGGSWRTARVLVDEWGLDPSQLRLVFVDTLYEDADAYRFLLEGAADIFGVPLSSVPQVEDFPDYRVDENVPIEEYQGNPDWRRWIAELRQQAAVQLPGLIWLCQGRDIWEVFRDTRYLGNSRVDNCSRDLKRDILDRWRKANCDPAADRFHVGIGEHEFHRFDDKKGGGLGPRMKEMGWDYHAPLLGLPEVNPSFIMEGRGIAPPRLYGLGYMHNNCGGFCVKAGHAHYQNRARVHPERFAYDRMMERKLRVFLGSDAVTILNDRRGGRRVPMSLDEFHERLQSDPATAYAYEPGSSGCGCMVDG